MKKSLTILAAALLSSGAVLAADSSAADAVTDAAGKLAATDNYSWTMTTEGGQRSPGPSHGKTEKGGYTYVDFTMRDNTVDAVVKDGKGAIKTEDGWESLDDAAKDDGGGGFNPTRFLAMRLQHYKVPALEAADLAGKTKGLTNSVDGYSADLTEDGAKGLLSFRRPGGDGPTVSDAKGSVKFWVKDGVLTKYQYKVSGTVSFNGNDRDVDRTTTVEIKDVGTTKVTVPDEAKKKIT